MRAVKVIECDLEVGKIGFVFSFDASNLLFWRNAFFLGAQHDGCAVGVIGTNISTLVSAGLLKAYPDICLNVFQQVAQVNGAVCVWQGAGN